MERESAPMTSYALPGTDSSQPALVLAKVVRTPLSIRTLGVNVRVCWHEAATGEAGIVVQVRSYLLTSLWCGTNSRRPARTAYSIIPSSSRREIPFTACLWATQRLPPLPTARAKRTRSRLYCGRLASSMFPLRAVQRAPQSEPCTSEIGLSHRSFCPTEQGLLLATIHPAGLRWISWTALASQKGQASMSQLNAPDAFTPLSELDWLYDAICECRCSSIGQGS